MEYRSQMIMRQRETTEREDGMDRQTMALHHAEQEVVRLQCLLASAADVAPQVCQAIHKVAPGFDFKERGLQVSRVSSLYWEELRACVHFGSVYRAYAPAGR